MFTVKTLPGCSVKALMVKRTEVKAEMLVAKIRAH